MWAVNIIYGLAVGFIFGYILQRTGITKFPRVVGMLLLKDFKILKFMMTAVISSMILFYVLGEFGVLKLTFKPLDWGKLIGGLIFGTGMGILGYCPGTMAARIGEGKKDSIIALFGMALGLFIFGLMINSLKATLLNPEKQIPGDISVLLNINHWFLIIPAGILFSVIIYLVNKYFDDKKKIF